MDNSRPMALCHESEKHLPQQGERTVIPTPSVMQSPDVVTAEALRLVVANWELAGWWMYVTGRGVA